MAVVIRFMDDTLLRIGNREYARTNSTFGLTTLRKRHLDVEADELRLEFVGKGGKHIDLAIENPELAELARQCVEIPGYHLFKYFDEDGQRHRVESHHVNAYLQTVAEAPFTAKDFRTWSASATAAETLWETGGEAEGPRARKTVIVAMVEAVAALLNNTPAVCRGSYIHPGIIRSYEAGTFLSRYEQALAAALARPVEHLDTAEAALLELLPKLQHDAKLQRDAPAT